VNDPALQAMLAQAVAVALAAQKAEIVTSMPAKAATPKLSVAGKTERAIKNEIQTVRIFHRAGFKDAKPHVNVLTYRKWLEKGRRPLEGSKALRVSNLRLWHVSQTRPITTEELKATKDQQQAAIKRHGAKVIPIGGEAHPQ